MRGMTREEADASYERSAQEWNRRQGEWGWSHDESKVVYMKYDRGLLHPDANWASHSAREHDTTVSQANAWIAWAVFYGWRWITAILVLVVLLAIMVLASTRSSPSAMLVDPGQDPYITSGESKSVGGTVGKPGHVDSSTDHGIAVRGGPENRLSVAQSFGSTGVATCEFGTLPYCPSMPDSSRTNYIKIHRSSPITLTATEPVVPVGRSVESQLRLAANHFGIDAQRFVDVMRCESGLRADAVGDHGLAVGVAQFHPRTFQANALRYWGYDIGDARLDPMASATLAAWMWTQHQERQWSCYA